MTRTISIITATVGAALLFAVPALADNWGADKAQPATTVTTSDAFERAAAVGSEQRQQEMLSARERALDVRGNQSPVGDRGEGLNRLYGLGEYAPSVAQPARSEGMNRLYGLGEYSTLVADDRFRIDPSVPNGS